MNSTISKSASPANYSSTAMLYKYIELLQYKHNIYTTHKYYRRWAPEVKITFIFFIGKVIFDKNLLKADERSRVCNYFQENAQ